MEESQGKVKKGIMERSKEHSEQQESFPAKLFEPNSEGATAKGHQFAV